MRMRELGEDRASIDFTDLSCLPGAKMGLADKQADLCTCGSVESSLSQGLMRLGVWEGRGRGGAETGGLQAFILGIE